MVLRRLGLSSLIPILASRYIVEGGRLWQVVLW